MSKENNIRKGMLSEKMRNFQAVPPADAWDNIAAQLPRGGSRKVFLIVLTTAAGLALAITVGVKFIASTPEIPGTEKQDVALVQEEESDKPATEAQPNSLKQQAEPKRYNPPKQSEGAQTDTQIAESDIPEEPGRASRLEEKVMLAMEEVIQEGEDEALSTVQQNEVILAENIEEVEENEDTATETETATKIDLTEIDQEAGTDQQLIDQEASQKYLDSLSNAAIPDEELDPDNETAQKKWQLGASLTPLFSYRDASSTDLTQNLAANNSESGVLAYSGGVQVRYAQSDRLTFESGLYYNKMGLAIGNFEAYRSRMDYMFENVTYTDNSIVSMSNSIGTIAIKSSADVVVNAFAGPSTEVDIFNSLDSKEMRVQNEVVTSFEQSLNYLEIPFNMKYKILDRSLAISLIGGISTNLLVGNQVHANTANGKLDYGSVQDIRTVNYSGNAGLGFVYEFPGNFSLSLEPRFRYYINSINEDYLPSTRPYALGVYTGVNYTF